jgi:hypothetical protein
VDAAPRGLPRDGLGREACPFVGDRGDLRGREIGLRAGDRDRFVLVRRLAARPDRADDLTVNLQRDPARQAAGPVERQRAEAPARHLLLHLTARPDEDRRGPRLVDGDAGARDLSALGAPELDELAERVDDRHDDAGALLERCLLGSAQHRLGARVVEDSACADKLHGHAPFAFSTAAQIAVSAVM